MSREEWIPMDLLEELHSAANGGRNQRRLAADAAKEIKRLQGMNDLLKREVLAASTIVMIGGREMVVHPIVKAEIERLRQAAVDALARLAKGALGWGVAKDILRLALSDKPLQ